MARLTGSVCKLCRREGMKLFLKGQRCFSEKCGINRRDYPPGMHVRPRKTTDYCVQLREKQKAKRIYGVLERQFTKYFKTAVRTKGNTGQNLLVLLERRLDNVVRRSGFCRTIWQARQTVVHGHITVNGVKTDRPSFMVKPGDTIAVRGKSEKAVQAMADSVDAGNIVPAWMTVEGLKCKIDRLPDPDEIFRPFETNMLAVVEFMK